MDAAKPCFTVITSTTPDRVGKIYSLDAKGLRKTAVASIAAGDATTIEATPENLVTALKRTTKSTNQVIALDSFIGATPGAPAEIGIVTEAELERRIGGRIPSAPDTGFYTVNDKPVAARLKRLMQSSGWILIDADTPEGMPAQWARLSLTERLKLLEANPAWDLDLPQDRISRLVEPCRQRLGRREPGADARADPDQRSGHARQLAPACSRPVGSA